MTFEGRKEEARNVEHGRFWQPRFDSDPLERVRTCSASASVCQEIRFESGFRTRRPGDPLNGDGRANGDRGEGVNGARREMDSGAVADADASRCDSRPGVEQCANAQPTKE